MTSARPSIHGIGQVHDDGETITVSGWSIGLCASGCRCHSNAAGSLTIARSDDGHLGLVSYWQCDCCAAWSVGELLQAVLRDVSDVRALESAG